MDQNVEWKNQGKKGGKYVLIITEMLRMCKILHVFSYVLEAILTSLTRRLRAEYCIFESYTFFL